MEIQADKISVNMDTGTVTITGYDIAEIISEIGAEEILLEMDFEHIARFIEEEAELEAEEIEHHQWMRKEGIS